MGFFVTFEGIEGCGKSTQAKRMADYLESLGHQVVATDINEQGLTDAARADGWSDTQVIRRRLDVRDGADWQRALDATLAAFGRLDVLMNVAGYLLPGWSWELDATQIDRHLDINVKGVMHGVTVVGKYFVGKGKGHIINRGFSEGYAVAVLLSVLIAAFAWSEWRAVKGTVGELVGLRPAPAPLPAGAR